MKEISQTDSDDLVFKPITEDFVEKQINKISKNKATGFDEISPKILKIANQVVKTPIAQLINKYIATSVFPDKLKIAQVVSIHKKNSTLLKGNYRPVSVLPRISKFFEEQLIFK